MKIRPVAAELFQSDGLTDEADTSFPQFCKRAYKLISGVVLYMLFGCTGT